MKLKSKLSCDEYLRQLRQGMRSVFDISRERFSGFIFGKFFSISYHAINWRTRRRIESDSKWPNKRYNAFGFVKCDEFGTEISCLCTTGWLDPISLISFFTVGLLAFLNDGFLFKEPAFAIFTAMFFALIAAILSAITDSFTYGRYEGRDVLIAFLKDPTCHNSLFK